MHVRVSPRWLLRGVWQLYLWNGGVVSDLFDDFSISVGEVVEAAGFAAFEDIAEHDNAGDFFLPEHELKIGLSTFQRSLRDEDSGMGANGNRISVDVSGWGVLIFSYKNPGVLVWVSAALQMDC